MSIPRAFVRLCGTPKSWAPLVVVAWLLVGCAGDSVTAPDAQVPVNADARPETPVTGDEVTSASSRTPTVKPIPLAGRAGPSSTDPQAAAVTAFVIDDGQATGIPEWAADPDYVPQQKARANRRWVAPDGDDAQDGLTRETAWRTLSNRIDSLPADTEVVFADGVHAFAAQEVVLSNRGSAPLPAGLTLRSQSYRGAILRGDPDAGSGGIAFDIVHARDLELWGLRLEGWHGAGEGVIRFGGNVDALRLVGLQARDNGTRDAAPFIREATPDTATAAPRSIAILHADVHLPDGAGAFLMSSPRGQADTPTSRALGWSAVEVAYNRVTGTGAAVLIQDSNLGVAQAVRIHHNDFRVASALASLAFIAEADGHGSFIDYRFENNVLIQMNPEGRLMSVALSAGAATGHAFSARDNLMRTSGKPQPSTLPSKESGWVDKPQR